MAGVPGETGRPGIEGPAVSTMQLVIISKNTLYSTCVLHTLHMCI